MNEYEVLVVESNPCAGEELARRSFLEVTAESPEAYVKSNAKWPVVEINHKQDGETIILTADGYGNWVRYTFSEV